MKAFDIFAYHRILHGLVSALKSFQALILLLLVYSSAVFLFPTLHVSPSTVENNNAPLVPQRQFPHEFLENFTDTNHTHYMDHWGFDVLCNYKSQMRVNSFSSDSITLLTQMVLDDLREQRLLDLASRWSGFISVAIYFAMDTTFKISSLEEALQVIDRLRAKHSILETVHFHVVVNTGREVGYPYNFLRNVALNNAVTDYVMVLDADLIPPPNAHDTILQKFKTLPELMSNEKTLLILPSFERLLLADEKSTSLRADDLPSTKAAVLKQMEDNPGMLEVFLKNEWERCHKPTNFPLWFKSSQIYLVKYEFHFEPYYVIRKTPSLPPFWEHFTGFGFDKLSWVEEIAAAGYHFYVSPDEFLIHIQHGHSSQYSTSRQIGNKSFYEYEFEFLPYVKKRYGTYLYDITPPYVPPFG
jgi:glycosyltransferase-like protein LARGE